MKRILALLCAIACLCCLAVPVFAANDTVTIHAYVPGDWSDVRLWAWDDSQQNASATDWPGDLVMTQGDDGWYSIEIPANFPNMLINANGGGAQTGDINGVDITKEVWIVVNNDKTTQIFDAKPDDVVLPGDPGEQEPAALESLALVGDGIPGVGSWIVEDAAGDMTKESDSVYTKEIAVTSGTTMKFKIAGNDSWESGYNYGGAEEGVAVALGTALELTGGAESKDLTLTADKDCTLKFTVTLTDGAASLLVEEVAGSNTTDPQPTEPQPTEPADTEPVETEPVETEPAETEPVETKPAETQPAGNNEVKPTDNTVLFAIIGSVVVIAIAAVVFIVLKKKQ